MVDSPDFLATATKYASWGWSVFPLDGKEPLTTHGVKDATTDKTIIEGWAKKWPTVNIGVACGKQSFIVLDFDKPEATQIIATYVKEKEIDTAKEDLTTISAKTGKGHHLFYAWTDGCERLRNWTNVIDGLDIRTVGGYVVVSPSIHPETQVPYEWINSPDDGELKPIPKWLLDFLLESRKKQNFNKLEDFERESKRRSGRRNRDDNRSAYGQKALEDEIATLRSTGKGNRNNQLNESAIKLFGLVKAGELDKSEVKSELKRAARSIGLKTGEIEKTIQSAWNGASTRDLPESSTPASSTPCKIDCKSVVKDKKNSNGEFIGDTFSPTKAAKTVLRNFNVLTTRGARSKDPLTTWIYDEESGLFVPDGEFRIKAALNEVVGDLFTLNMARETIAKIQYESICDLDELDGDPYLFPVEDKVIDLRTGAVMDYSPELKLTKKSPIKYNPNAKCPTILNFLFESLADSKDILSIIDLFVAMSIKLPFDLFVILLGQGSNGKLKLENLIEKFFGSDQVTAVRLESLGKNQFSAGELIGKRALINSEVSGSAKESDWMKRIASGDPIDTDVKHAGHILFRPYCLQIFDCNNPPQFYDNSFGLARRLGKFDFPFKFVDNPDPNNPYEKKKDPKLGAKITTDEELSGLLNLIIARAPSLIESGSVYLRMSGEEAIVEYTHQARNMESFVDECCEVDEHDYNMHAEASKLYKTYEQYCETWNISPVTENKFGRHITTVTGAKSVSENGIRYRHFICLKENAIRNRLQPITTDSEQNNRYQEQIPQITNPYFIEIVNQYFTSKEGNISYEKKCSQKSVKSVESVPDSDYSVQDQLYSVWDLFELGGRVEKDEGPNTGKIEMATPTKKEPPWANVSGGPDLLEGLQKFNGRLTAEDMINSFGWDSKHAKFTIELLVDRYGWMPEKLVSGLVVFRPPKVEA